jgi:hypothetical protein
MKKISSLTYTSQLLVAWVSLSSIAVVILVLLEHGWEKLLVDGLLLGLMLSNILVLALFLVEHFNNIEEHVVDPDPAEATRSRAGMW